MKAVVLAGGMESSLYVNGDSGQTPMAQKQTGGRAVVLFRVHDGPLSKTLFNQSRAALRTEVD